MSKATSWFDSIVNSVFVLGKSDLFVNYDVIESLFFTIFYQLNKDEKVSVTNNV